MTGTFVKNTSVTLITRILQLLFGVGTSIIIARVLGPEGKGIYSLAILLPTILFVVTQLGMGPASVYYTGKKKYSVKKILGVNIIFSILISIFAVIIGLIIIFFFSGKSFPGVPKEYLFLALSLIPFQIFLNFVVYILLGLQKIKKFNFIQLIRTGIFLVLIAIFLLGFRFSIKAAIIAQVLSYFIGCIVLFYQIKKEAKGIIICFKKKLFKDFLSYGTKIYFGNVASWLHLRADLWMINIFINPLAVGYYSIAVSLSEQIWLVSQSAGTVLYPRVSSETDNKRLKEFTPIVCRNILFITILVAVILFFLGRWIITLFYSKEFLSSVLPFQILLIGAIMLSGNRILTGDLSGRGRLKRKMFIIIGTTILNVVLNILWIPKWGIIGAAWATVVSYTINFLLIIIIYTRISGNKVRDIIFIKKSDLNLYRNVLKNFSKKSGIDKKA